MKKLITGLLFLATCISLFSQQIFIERIGTQNLITIIYPTDVISFNTNTPNDLVIQALIIDGEELIDKHTDLVKLYPIKNKDRYLFYQYFNKAEPGFYDLYLNFDNRTLNRKSEKKYEIEIPEKSVNCSGFYLSYLNNGNAFIPYKKDWQSEADSIRIYFYSNQNLTRLNFITNGKVIPLEFTNNLAYTLPDSISKDDLSKAYLEYSFNSETHKKDYELYSTKRIIMTKYPIKEQLQQLRLLMTQNEYEYIRKIPKHKLEEEITFFWDKHDSNPATEENEFQELIYKRILEADDRYTIVSFKPGWKTDFGRVYIKYGDPDEILKENYPIGKYPVVIWYYYKLDKAFYFDDKKGFGNYELRNSEDF